MSPIFLISYHNLSGNATIGEIESRNLGFCMKNDLCLLDGKREAGV